jgi:hypothetical protein
MGSRLWGGAIVSQLASVNASVRLTIQLTLAVQSLWRLLALWPSHRGSQPVMWSTVRFMAAGLSLDADDIARLSLSEPECLSPCAVPEL